MRRAFAQLANYWDDQLQIQQQAADRMRRTIAEEIQDFHLTNQVGSCLLGKQCLPCPQRVALHVASVNDGLSGWRSVAPTDV